MRLLSLLLLLFILPLHAEEEIRVQLSTQESLIPLYLAKWTSNGSLSENYAGQLRAIFQFDLHHSGHAKVITSDETIEKTLESPDFATAARSISLGVSRHLIKASIEEKALSLYAYSVQTGAWKQFPPLTLTGDLSKDRRLIHKLADGVVKLLFNAPGVASSRILYSIQLNPNEEQWRAEIWECDWDGANPKQVTRENTYALTPVLIPGRDSFLYVSYKTGQPKIYTSGLSGRESRRVLDIRGNQLLPAISPQRDQLAFVCDASGRADLFVQELDSTGVMKGKPSQLFSFPNSTQASPTFSPDGKQIAFVSDKDGSARIYLISSRPGTKRSDARLLTRENRENTCPSWSPDGTKLAYSAKTNGIRQIWIYDFSTKEERQLTSGPGNKENPVWGPDSLHLIFNSTDPSSSELYLVNLNQPEAIKISQGPGKKHYPTWAMR